MKHDFLYIFELLNEYDVTLEDIEKYMVNFNLKCTKIMSNILPAIVAIPLAICGPFNTFTERISISIAMFVFIYIVAKIGSKIGHYVFVNCTNPYESTNQFRCLSNLDKLYKHSEKKFRRLLTKIAESKKESN